MMRKGAHRIGVFTLAILAFAACGDSNDVEDDPVVDPAEEITPSPAAQAEFDVESVELGRALGPDGRVAEALDEFSTSDTIYAVVRTEGAGPATVTARWLFGDGQLVDETSQTVTAGGETLTEFHVSKPDGWPAGEYEVKILVNGEEEESATFTVQ